MPHPVQRPSRMSRNGGWRPLGHGLFTVFLLVCLTSAAFPDEDKPAATPLDRLKAEDIPAGERFPWQPKGLIAVYGSHAWRHWYFGEFTAEQGVTRLTTDGKRVLVYSWSALLGEAGGELARITVAATGAEVARFREEEVSGAGYSPTGKLLGLAKEGKFDWTATVWDTTTKRNLGRVTGKGQAPFLLSFSPNGRILVAQYNPSQIHLFDLATGQHLYGRSYVGNARFHPDGRRLFYYASRHNAEGNALAGADVYQYDLVRKQETLLWHRPKVPPYRMAVSPDGRWLAVAFLYDAVQVWDINQRKAGPVIPLSSAALAFSPDSKTLACATWQNEGTDGRIVLYDPSTGKERTRLGDGLKSYSPVPALLHRHYNPGIYEIAFSSDGKRLAAARRSGDLGLLDVGTGERLNPQGEKAQVLAVSPDSRSLVLLGEDRVQLLDVVTGRRQPLDFPDHGQPLRATFSPDGKTLAITVSSGSVVTRIIDVATGKERARVSAGGTNRVVLFTPDGKSLVCCGDNCVTSFDTATWKETARTDTRFLEGMSDAVLSRDGKTLLQSTGVNVQILDVPTGRVQHTFDAPQTGLVALSPDGNSAASVGVNGGAVKIWSVKTDQVLYELKAHRGYVTGLCYDQTGDHVFTCGYDGRVIQWQRDEKKREWRLPGWIASMQLSPEGRHLFVNNGNGTVYMLRLEEVAAP